MMEPEQHPYDETLKAGAAIAIILIIGFFVLCKFLVSTGAV